MEASNNIGCKRMQINDTKAGMQNIDKDKINSIILKHSQSITYNLAFKFYYYNLIKIILFKILNFIKNNK